MSSSVIGTLNEGSLHAQLKDWYRCPGDLIEHPVDGYVIDLVRSGTLIEIQTGGFAPLRRKLERLLDHHSVRLVVPVPLSRRIVRLSLDGEVLSSRRSPRRGRIEDVFSRLVSLPGLLAHPHFSLELLLTHEQELRRHEPGRAFVGWEKTKFVVAAKAVLALCASSATTHLGASSIVRREVSLFGESIRPRTIVRRTWSRPLSRSTSCH